jgi:hypothetical protein
MTPGTNDEHRFNQIGGIPTGGKSNLWIVFSVIKMPQILIKKFETGQEVCIW